MHRFLGRAVLAMGLTVALAAPATAAGAPQWQSVGPNASGGYLAFTAAAPSRLYVLPDGGRAVYRSDDHGVTWASPATFATGVSGTHLAADQRDANLVYVAASVLGGGQGHVYRSTDGARTFRPVLDDKADITDVAVAGHQVFAAGASGVFESDDRGAHWSLLKGSPTGAKRLVPDGDTLFVGTDNAVYRIDGGEAQKLALPGDIFVEYLAARGQLVVASQERDGSAVISTDGGRSWRAMTGPWGKDWVSFLGVTPNGDLRAQTLEPSADGPNARKNTWVSPDNGRHWTAEPQALPTLDLYADLGSFPDRPRELVISAAAGIYTTTDSATFRRIGVPAVSVGALAVSGQTLIAGTSVDSYHSTAPLLRKLPAGYQDWGWTGKAPATIGNVIGGVAALPDKDLVRVRIGFCPDECIALERSHDGGTTWQQQGPFVPGSSRSMAVDPHDPSKLYIATYLTGASLYTSTDGGKTLTPQGYDGSEGAWAVATGDSGVWIATPNGLFHSTDSGATATKAFDGNVKAVAVSGNRVVAVGTNLAKESRDGGKTFVDTKVPAADYDAVTFGADGSVYLGSGTSLLRNGTDISAGLPDRDVHSLLATADWLFVGTGSSGVYRLPLR